MVLFMEIKRFEGNGRTSKAVIYNGVLYISGIAILGAEGEGGDITEQTLLILGKIEQILLQYGSGKDKLLSATIHLKDMSMKAEMDAAWKKWIIPGKEPSRTTVQAGLAESVQLIEITMSAAV